MFQKNIFEATFAILCLILMTFVGVSRIFSENGENYGDHFQFQNLFFRTSEVPKFPKPNKIYSL